MLQSKKLPVCYALLCIMAGLFFGGGAFSDEGGMKSAVLVSKKIRPYLQVVDGIVKEAGKSPNTVDVFFLMPGDTSMNRELIQSIGQSGFDMVLAVGPEAASFVWNADFPMDRLYGAVLDPATIPGIDTEACGISLRIPVGVQLNHIARTFPAIKRIGLLFDPANNQWFYERASRYSLSVGITIVPFEVSARSQITKAITREAVDAIWMIPDQTIISEKVVQFVIKQGVYHNTGVIGYNPFFIRSGALFSFEFDYAALGLQIGRKMLGRYNGDPCFTESPVFNTLVNEKIAKKIGVEVVP